RKADVSRITHGLDRDGGAGARRPGAADTPARPHLVAPAEWSRGTRTPPDRLQPWGPDAEGRTGRVDRENPVRAERTWDTTGIRIRVRSLSLTSATSNKSTVSGSLSDA